MKRLQIPFIALLCAVFAGAGCQTTLTPGGAYSNDELLYQADRNILRAYDSLHSFVLWEFGSREALSRWPEIRTVADTVRRGAKDWIGALISARDAFNIDRSPTNKITLEGALKMIQSAIADASLLMIQYSDQ